MLHIIAVGGLIVLVGLIMNGVRGAQTHWFRVHADKGKYTVEVPSEQVAVRDILLLTICYYPRLRATIGTFYPSEAQLQSALDDAVLKSLSRLSRGNEQLPLYQLEDFRALIPETSHEPILIERTYYGELRRGRLLCGVADYHESPASTDSLVLHYTELLRVVSNGLSPELRSVLLTTLGELIEFTRNLPNSDSGIAVGRAFTEANLRFRERWAAVADRDGYFEWKEAVRSSSLCLSRIGFHSRLWIKVSALAAYPLTYHLTSDLAETFGIAFPLHALLWILAGLLTAHGIGRRDGRQDWARAMRANALWRHGQQFRRASTVFLYIASLLLLSPPLLFRYVFPCAAITTVFFLAALTEVGGYGLFARLSANVWRKELRSAAYLDRSQPPAKVEQQLPYWPLFLTFSHFTVLVPYALVLAGTAFVLKIGRVGLLGVALILPIMMTMARYGIPFASKRWHAKRPSRFRAVLLRKFFAESQARMLRNIVSPCIGVYGTLTTLSDPTYQQARERAPSTQQEAAASMNDVLGQLQNAIQSSDASWKPDVQRILAMSDIVVIDVTRVTPSLAWELAEALRCHSAYSVLLVCDLEARTADTLSLASVVQDRLQAEISARTGHADVDNVIQRFNRVLPPLIYASFPCSMLFRIQLARRLSLSLSCPGVRSLI